jgi:type IV secretion system protein TrbF
MSFTQTIRGLIFKPSASNTDRQRSNEGPGSSLGNSEDENPYLATRRSWNDQAAANMASRQMWQLLGSLALMVALASVGGMVYIGSQSKFVPYVVEVNKLGERAAVAPAQLAGVSDARVVRADVAAFISDIRMVSPDVALQRKAVYRMYAMLSASDAAMVKANDWLNSTEDSSPFKRAAKEIVSIDIVSVLPQTGDTWQVDWTETVRDRQGVLKSPPFRMRALVTVYTVPTTPDTTEQQLLDNPLGTHVRDFSWSKQI